MTCPKSCCCFVSYRMFHRIVERGCFTHSVKWLSASTLFIGWNVKWLLSSTGLGEKRAIKMLILYIFMFVSKYTTFAEVRDDGGWTTEEKDMIAKPGPCNIEVRDANSLTQKEFIDRYAYSKPVVIRGATDNTIFQYNCRKDLMLNHFGSKKIRLSSANTYSYRKADVTLLQYVEDVLKPQKRGQLGNETFYWFGDNNYTEWEELFNLYKPPPYKIPKMSGAYSFGLAGAGTGVPFHFHGPGFGEVVFGRKRWFMYNPSKTPSFNPDKTTLQWLLEDYSTLHPDDLPLECTINKGEIIYFPDRWWHGTLNIDTSVFISTFLAY